MSPLYTVGLSTQQRGCTMFYTDDHQAETLLELVVDEIYDQGKDAFVFVAWDDEYYYTTGSNGPDDVWTSTIDPITGDGHHISGISDIPDRQVMWANFGLQTVVLPYENNDIYALTSRWYDYDASWMDNDLAVKTILVERGLLDLDDWDICDLSDFKFVAAVPLYRVVELNRLYIDSVFDDVPRSSYMRALNDSIVYLCDTGEEIIRPS